MICNFPYAEDPWIAKASGWLRPFHCLSQGKAAKKYIDSLVRLQVRSESSMVQPHFCLLVHENIGSIGDGVLDPENDSRLQRGRV